MDSSLATALITNAGIAGIVIILIICRVLTPGWYSKKLEKENELLAATAERVTAELVSRNELISELRLLAIARNDPAIVKAALGQGVSPVGFSQWLASLRRGRLSSSELDQRVARAEKLAETADRHIKVSTRLREQNHYAVIVEEALGLASVSRFRNGEAR